MSAASIRAIFQEHGIVPMFPNVPNCSQRQMAVGNAKSVVYQRVPNVPNVPTQKSKVETRDDETAFVRRPIVQFRLGGTGWATALGVEGETAESLIADLRQRWPGVEVAHD